MEDRLAVTAKSACAVRHQALALRGANLLTEIGFSR